MSQRVFVDMAYEQFLKALFGANDYHSYVDGVSFVTWRKDLTRIIRNLKRAILLTVHSDAQHIDALAAECDSAMEQVKQSKTHQEATETSIRYLAKIAFLLIGEFPDHYNDKHVTHDNYWILNHERQIGYTQSLSQKAMLIRRLAREGRLRPELDGSECDRKYHELRGNAREFLQWMKEQHPQAYLRCL